MNNGYGTPEATARTILKKDARPLSERKEAFIEAFRKFVNAGGFQWDAILSGLAEFIRREEVGFELWGHGAATTYTMTAKILDAVSKHMITVDWTSLASAEKETGVPQARFTTVNLADYEIDVDALKLLTKEQCERHLVVALARKGNTLVVAMADPTDLNALDDLKFLAGYNIEPVIASQAGILYTIARYYTA